MKHREGQAWTDYVRELETRKSGKKAKCPRPKKQSQPSPAELEAVLDDLVTEPEP